MLPEASLLCALLAATAAAAAAPVDEVVVEGSVGTLFRRRYCRAVFEERAFADEGRTAIQIGQNIQDQLTRGSRDPIMPAGPPVQAIVAIEARRPAFRKHLEDVARRNPELLRLLKERHELELRYKAARQETIGQKLP
jgi:hypothetical protein